MKGSGADGVPRWAEPGSSWRRASGPRPSPQCCRLCRISTPCAGCSSPSLSGDRGHDLRSGRRLEARSARSLDHHSAGFMAPKGKRPFHSGSTCVVVADFDLTFFCSQPDRQAFRRGFHLFRLPQGALPYRRHAPPVFEESCANGAVSSDVRIELRPPELRPSCRYGRVAATLMSVPEAAMHEDHGAVLWKDKVRSAVNLAEMKPEAETARVQCPPESQLRLGVLSPDPRHHPGTGLLVHDIGHICPGFRP
ncbi:hypothetical protein BCL74_2521 [Oceanibaculum indicum]|uniref:Uncharacterized protein n=1 Tax=Oceanibaculum indicum TaxID=526216 RepID=A0A420WHV7_9PROT|nr:hypothetical protein BCL74_2521 [Oceanibaculum indicum]